jgi:hypothetical protein
MFVWEGIQRVLKRVSGIQVLRYPIWFLRGIVLRTLYLREGI